MEKAADETPVCEEIDEGEAEELDEEIDDEETAENGKEAIPW